MDKSPSLYKRIENEVDIYLTKKVELSEGVMFSQHETINRIYKFKGKNLSGSKVKSDLSYDYHFDIISPRIDSEIKNLRFDSKHILVFSRNPRLDFPAVFIANASIKAWMADNGEDEKLKEAIEEFVANGNIGFKKVDGGYEFVDPINTFITNQKAKTIDDTDIVERHELTATQIRSMEAWDEDAVKETIKECGNKQFQSTAKTTPSESTSKRYEVFEFTGEVSETEFNEVSGLKGGDSNTYFLAKVIVAGLNKAGTGEKYTLFAQKLNGDLSDHYIYAHRGKYNGRFWREGMYELLFDHQIRANEIGNQLASGLEWASKVVFKSKDSKVLQNIRADVESGDIIITEDLSQVDVRMRNLDQLIADWNRLMSDADRVANSYEIVRGEAMPSGTPFRMGLLVDANAGKLFTLLRQKITLPYKRVFKNWVMPDLVSHLKGEDIFRLVGDKQILDELYNLIVESWYIQNLVKIGPHNRETAEAIKQEKLEEVKKTDPVIKNSEKIWKGVLPRLFVTITGENSDMADNIQDMVSLLNLETDPNRIAFLLDSIYKMRGIPIPPKVDQMAPDMMVSRQGAATEQSPSGQQQPAKTAEPEEELVIE
jgi:hypothetical protein